MFNLIPIPPLDGASLAFIAFEALAKKTIPDDIMEKIRTLGVIMLGVIAPLLALAILAENF
jgi:membrane-associated protease RseP (regulator of RpoE activity)